MEHCGRCGRESLRPQPTRAAWSCLACGATEGAEAVARRRYELTNPEKIRPRIITEAPHG